METTVGSELLHMAFKLDDDRIKSTVSFICVQKFVFLLSRQMTLLNDVTNHPLVLKSLNGHQFSQTFIYYVTNQRITSAFFFSLLYDLHTNAHGNSIHEH